MTNKPLILLTNDDGITAPGLNALWKAVKEHADVCIVAPSSQRSGSGLALTFHTPIFAQTHPWENTPSWHISGTPVDCVRLALSVFLDRTPDLILSGINAGVNYGRVILYSGTLACVIEGALRGVPGIAFSCYDMQDTDYDSAKPYIWPIVHHFLDHPIPKGSFINVNFPSKQIPFKGIKLARQGLGYWMENPDIRSHPENGANYYWAGLKWAKHEEHKESDVHLIEQGFATVVPMRIAELTDQSFFEGHKELFELRFKKENSSSS